MAIIEITEELCNAYFMAEYRIYAPSGPFNLHARGSSNELSALHELYDVKCSALITAYNPYSIKIEDEVNQVNQQLLINTVSHRWDYLLGAGVDRKGEWPAEPAILVLGISLDDACELGREFKQHAIIYTLGDETDLKACRPENQSMMIHPLERMMESLDRHYRESGLPVGELKPTGESEYVVNFVPKRAKI